MSPCRIKTCVLLLMLLANIGVFAQRAEASGTTLSVGTATLTVTHANNNIPASDTSIYLGDTVTLSFPGSLSTSGTNPSSGKECTLDSATWTWSIVSVSYSADGSTWNASSYTPAIGGGSTGTMSAIFPTAGFWKVTVHVHVDIVSSTCGNYPLDQDIGPNGFSVAKGDFSIGATLNPSTIVAGGSGTASVTVTPLAGFNGNVNLSLQGAPTGVTGDSFYVSPVYPNPVQRPFGIYVAETVAPGTYPALISGVSGVIGHSAPIAFTVPKRYVEIDGSYDKNMSKASDGSQFVPKRMPDGSLVVDSVVDFNTNWSVWADSHTYTAIATGFTPTQNYGWSITGGMNNIKTGAALGTPQNSFTATGNSTDSEPMVLWSIQNFSSNGGPPTTSFPGSSTISVNVSNSGGSLVTTTHYTINWHYAGENYKPYGQPIPTSLEIDPAAPIQDGDPAIAGGTIHCTFDPAGNYYIATVQNGVAQTFSVASNFADPPYSALLSALSLTVGATNLGLTTYKDDTNTFNAWQEAVALTKAGNRHVPPGFETFSNQTVAWQECQMTQPVISAHYVDQYYAGDAYDHTGYLGPNAQDHKAFRKSTQMQATGTYTQLP